jgi:mannose-6-phosphate isomerase-like protein (cupin superfamily)
MTSSIRTRLNMVVRVSATILLPIMLMTSQLHSQQRKVDPTWLHRFVPNLSDANSKMATQSCHYKPLFGEGDKDAALMQSVSRVSQVTIEPNGACQPVLCEREEEIYFILQGSGLLRYGDDKTAMRTNDSTYLAPGAKHSIENDTGQALRVLVMGFNIPSSVSISGAPTQES